MNIFVLSEDPVQAAQWQCDKHVVKMILESAQMLSSAVVRHGGECIYKPTHKHHPCTIWAGDTKDNWYWLHNHFIALGNEYTERYGKQHLSLIKMYEWIKSANSIAIHNIPDGPLTPFAQAMPEEYKRSNAVDAYRAYYIGEKARFATWKRNKPEWWPN